MINLAGSRCLGCSMSHSARQRRTFPIAQVIAIGMLAWALVPTNPYGYYILLRFVVCGVCAYLAVKAYQLERIPWVWVLGITAVLYNPLIRVHLTREIWSVVNVATIVLLLVTSFGFRKRGGRTT